MTKLITALFAAAILVTAASAAAPPETITFTPKSGKVTFPHKAHGAKGCKTCHTAAPGKIAGFNKDQAHATLNGGKTAEIKLKRFQGMTDEPAVLKNVKYWATPRNDGFVMMPNELETYKEGPKAYEFKGTNGFMLTFDMTSKDLAPQKGSMGN